jgi:hypothetical protein
MSLASGEYIKPILQDDYIQTTDALEKQIKVLDSGSKWVASGCWHINENNKELLFNPHPPQWAATEKLLTGFNLIGSPSVVMHVNDGTRYDVIIIYFSRNMAYLLSLKI